MGGRLLGWVSVRVGGKRGLVDAEPAPHRPEGTVGPFREGCPHRPEGTVGPFREGCRERPAA